MKKVKKFHIILWGLLVGAINGFFGGGGGMVVVPLLNKIFNLEQKKAQATAIFVILPISIASAIIYLKQANLHIFSYIPLCLGVVAGGAIGAILLSKMKNKYIKLAFTIVMFIAGISLLLK